MNTKDKVEAYVRSQIPELMELSEGCKVKIRFIDGDWVKGIVTTSVLPNQCAAVAFDGMGSQYITETTKYKIIGHPIQLQHWLEVLRKCGKAVCIRTDGIARPYMPHPGASDEMMEWGVDRHELRFNRDGQPATEADYQALAEILNIEV